MILSGFFFFSAREGGITFSYVLLREKIMCPKVSLVAGSLFRTAGINFVFLVVVSLYFLSI